MTMLLRYRFVIIGFLTILAIGFHVSAFAEKGVNANDSVARVRARKQLAAFEKQYVKSLQTDDLDYQLRCLNAWCEEAKRLGDADVMTDAIGERIVFYYNNDLNDSLLVAVPRDRELLKAHEKWDTYYSIWMYMVNTYIFSGSAKTGLEEVKRMFDDAMSRGHQYGIGLAYLGMGNAYTNMGNWQESIDSYDKSLDILSALNPPPVVITEIFTYYGDALNDMKNYKKLEKLTVRWHDFLVDFIKLKKLSASPKASIFWSYYFIACTQASLGLNKLDQAGQALDGVKKLVSSDRDYVGMAYVFYRAELLLKQGHYQEALRLNTRRRQLMEETHDDGVYVVVNRQRAEILEHLGHYAEAARLYRDIYLFNDSVNAYETKQQLNEMNTLFGVAELERKQEHMQMEQERMQMEQKQTRLRWIIAVAVLIALSLSVFLLIRLRAAKRLKQAHDELLVAYDQLETTTAAKEQIESELRIAREIQMGMVPHEFPECPQLDLYASMVPAKEVGGDLYDFILLDNVLYFCLGDVSGKGVPASLFMAQSTRLFRALAKQQMSPAEIATRLNAELAENNENGMFVTMFIGVANLDTGHLDFCNAGHNPPVFKGEFMEMLPNAPIGLWPELDYEGESVDNIKGEPLFIYTDGLNEAENEAHDQFGDDHLLEVMRSYTYVNARETIEMLQHEVALHVAGASPSDDLTMLCLKINE